MERPLQGTLRVVQIITRPQRRGAEIFATQLSNELVKNGHEVLMASIFTGFGPLHFDGKLVRLDLERRAQLFSLDALKKLAKIIDSFEADIVQANASDTLKFSALSKLLFSWNAKLVFRNANEIGDFINHPLKKWINQFWVNQLDGVASVSKASAKSFLKTFDFPSDTIEILPIGIPIKEIELKNKLEVGFPIEHDFFIFLGGLVNEKDPIGLLEIYQSALNEKPDLPKLVYVGSGELELRLKEKIKEGDLTEHVQVIENMENVFPLLTRSKALLMTSKIEGLPAVIIEAMCCNVPVVAYDVGGISEVLSNETGWLIPYGDSKSFVDALILINTVPTEDLKLRIEKAYSIVSQCYTMEIVSKEFERFYRKLIH